MSRKHEKEVEEDSVEDATRLSARLIYEVIRRDGHDELNRPRHSLIWSGLAAGILISFSVIGEAIFRAYLPDAKWIFLLENLGYSFGFLLVILGRMQLFTENTITTVLPLMAQPCREYLWKVVRLWGIVLTANVVGAFVAAAFLIMSGAFQPEVLDAIRELSLHATGMSPWQAFVKALPAGVLVAAIVWMLPTAPRQPFFIILTFTWLLAAGDFTHIIAGAVEMAYLLLQGDLALGQAVFGFFFPVLIGNVIGGTAVFTMITWGQVKAEVAPASR
ncbi:formate/nitrite transporter family protein [Mesobaculum littorinae]|uniref:Formate/nitrite transporter family protein n=1 Tax=Mesobaculum littorinae TaxID=2486419 RepID=A0A438AI00_9RHOB|nr:formate/nitrite transporter family protein [Mesobaculum littorinae]RVV98255.1 formate/nitrite transporter family protein [Mesobaculum littorinae]